MKAWNIDSIQALLDHIEKLEGWLLDEGQVSRVYKAQEELNSKLIDIDK